MVFRNQQASAMTSLKTVRGRQEGGWDSDREKAVEIGRIHSMKTLVF